MKKFFTKEDIGLLNLLIRFPGNLPLGEVGLKPFAIEQKDAVRFLRVQAWLENHVLTAKEKNEDGSVKSYDFVAKEVGIKQAYLEYLTTIVEHYKPLGCSTQWVGNYFKLLWKLKGEEDTIEDDDPFEDAPDGEPVEPKPVPAELDKPKPVPAEPDKK